MIKLKIDNIKIREDLSQVDIIKKACIKNKIDFNLVQDWQILKKSIDARNKNDIFYNYAVMLEVKKEMDKKHLSKNVSIITDEEVSTNEIKVLRKSSRPPIIIGAGPAGLFCALTLIDNGIKPIIVEQGKEVNKREQDVNLFFKEGILNTSSNVQFGEGGAGTFSDGKLTTNLHTPLCKKVIDEFIQFGAPDQIAYINKPHIGTDNLVKIVANMRNYIIQNGGKFLFNTKAVDFTTKENKINSLICIQDGQTLELDTDTVILAIGHSSRDMFKTLYKKNVNIEQKNFSVGVRIEHKQEMINKAQYGTNTKLKLPPAEYKLAYHGENHSCYTFCMCPGGKVVASSSEENTIVTNGMSKFARDEENANSAILVNVTPNDLNSSDPLAGMYFQKELEEKAFILGGKNYYAPIQRVEDFLNNKKSTFIGEVKPSYKPGVTLSNLQEILPDFVIKTLKEGIIYFDSKLKGFGSPDSILTGVETRSSSPITIKRNEELMSNIEGLYPCGEGAGYAGGIVSAAVDGIRVGRAILQKE